MDKKELLEEVCMQIRVDVENWEIEAIEELLACVPEEKLRAYLSEAAPPSIVQFEKYWGPRCEEHEEGCPVCDAYAERDARDGEKK